MNHNFCVVQCLLESHI